MAGADLNMRLKSSGRQFLRGTAHSERGRHRGSNGGNPLWPGTGDDRGTSGGYLAGGNLIKKYKSEQESLIFAHLFGSSLLQERLIALNIKEKSQAFTVLCPKTCTRILNRYYCLFSKSK